MDKNTRILISGAGVAGLACAIWLGRNGFRPVVIEKSPTIRADGFIISLSHASYRYADRLDLLGKIAAKNAGIKQSSYHDRRGKAMLTLDYRDLFSGVDVVQIMREDLEDILHDAVRDLAEIRLRTSINKIDQIADIAQVTFDDGSEEEFDIVIGADGLHSNTRRLVFAEADVTQHYLGLFSSAYRLRNEIGLRDRFENHMERSRYMCVYTTRDDDLACVFIWQSDKLTAPPPDERYRELLSQYAGAPQLVQKVLEGFPEGQTVYMDPLIQIEMKKWSAGNVVLLGDAAYCLTLLSGQGASSAFWGACKLAEGLVASSKTEAFSSYVNA
ncbi:MAG: FAD-dependent monooxygenase, partial [Proteobacteria bacterium]|nr:FAD-dependent monooxygenase [Pseudomonadota bacterium]